MNASSAAVAYVSEFEDGFEDADQCLSIESEELILVSDDVRPKLLMPSLRDAYFDCCGSGEDLTDEEIVKYGKAEIKWYYRRTRPFATRLSRMIRRINEPIRRVAEGEGDEEAERILAIHLLAVESRRS